MNAQKVLSDTNNLFSITYLLAGPAGVVGCVGGAFLYKRSGEEQEYVIPTVF